MGRKQSVLKPMENLKRSFSEKFLEYVKSIGSILAINDESFYIVFNSRNNRAAFVKFKGKEEITVKSMTVKNYDFLTFDTDNEITETNCNEGHALWILKSLAN